MKSMESMNSINPIQGMPGYENLQAQQDAFLKAFMGGLSGYSSNNASKPEAADPKNETKDDDKETELILLPGETINCIRTWSSSGTGRLFGIEVATTQGRQFSAGDKEGWIPSHHLENEQKLAFLSGAASKYKKSLTAQGRAPSVQNASK